MKLRHILTAIAAVFTLGLVTPALPSAVPLAQPAHVAEAVTPYLQCTYSPSSSSRTTYGGSICFRHNSSFTVLFRTRITCQYFSGVAYITYVVRSGYAYADSGTWAWAYCQDHHQKPDRYSAPGPDIVIHSWVEYATGTDIAFVNGGF